MECFHSRRLGRGVLKQRVRLYNQAERWNKRIHQEKQTPLPLPYICLSQIIVFIVFFILKMKIVHLRWVEEDEEIGRIFPAELPPTSLVAMEALWELFSAVTLAV